MYGLRGCEPCVSCMGLGLLKELKFFESMLGNENLPSLVNVTVTKLLYYYDSDLDSHYCVRL